MGEGASTFAGFFGSGALLVWLASGFYQVNVDEVAIIERLGSFVSSGNGKAALVEQGLHYRLPWPIDEVFKIPVQQTRTLVVDHFFAPSDAYADFKRLAMRESQENTPELLSAIFDPYLVTADKNVVHMSITVTYRIDDPEAWITTVSHTSETTPTIAPGAVSGNGNAADMREQLFQQIVQHAMVSSISKVDVDHVLFEGNDKIPVILTNAIQKAMQLPDPSDETGKRLIDLGVDVQTVSVVATHWPQYQMVDDAFQSVLKARSDADSARNVAKSYANTAVTQAKSQQDTMMQEAGAYAKQVVDNATGEANRFTQVFAQYQKAPDVTRWNVYAEAVKSVSGNATRMVFGEPGQKTILTLDPPQFDAAQNGGQK